MVDTALHRSSKFPWVPCTRSRSVEALLIRLRISGPEKTSLVVRTPAPSERNFVSLGKGVPRIWIVCGPSGIMKLTDFFGLTSCPVTCSHVWVHSRSGWTECCPDATPYVSSAYPRAVMMKCSALPPPPPPRGGGLWLRFVSPASAHPAPFCRCW